MNALHAVSSTPVGWFLGVGLGGAAGAVLRFTASIASAGSVWATLGCNFVGSLLIGLLYVSPWASKDVLRLALGVGLAGGFTTFSAFSWELLEKIELGQYGSGALYLVSSVALCLGGCALGAFAGRLIWP